MAMQTSANICKERDGQAVAESDHALNKKQTGFAHHTPTLGDGVLEAKLDGRAYAALSGQCLYTDCLGHAE